ncbi:MAG: hypothetical protein AAGU32_21160 [Bacillota bacterium]
MEIIVWSKRQSSHASGDGAFLGLKGNRFFGDEECPEGKSYWT